MPSSCTNMTLVATGATMSQSYFTIVWFDLAVLASTNILVTNVRLAVKLANPTTVGAYVVPGASVWSTSAYSGPLCALVPVPGFPMNVTPGAVGNATLSSGAWLFYPAGNSGVAAAFYMDVPLNMAFAAGSTNIVGVAIQSAGGPDPVAAAAGYQVQNWFAQTASGGVSNHTQFSDANVLVKNGLRLNNAVRNASSSVWNLPLGGQSVQAALVAAGLAASVVSPVAAYIASVTYTAGSQCPNPLYSGVSS